ncbi:hypothetical protein CWI37_2246p0010, partial [Hamiltosporidium tvaerminnensis]
MNPKSKNIYRMHRSFGNFNQSVRYLIVILAIFGFLQVIDCVRIIVSFDTLKRQNCLIVNSFNSFNPTNINNSKESVQAESYIYPHNRCSFSATPNCSSKDIQHEENDSNKRRRLNDANKPENTHCNFRGPNSHTNDDVCTGGDIDQNSPALFSFGNRTTIETAIKFPGDIQIVLTCEPINIVTFDYSENYMIRSKYFDEFNNVKTSKKEIKIQDISN